MSTITTALPFDPSDRDARWQFALAVGEKATEITGPHDGLYTVTVRGLGEANLRAAIDSFTPTAEKAPNPPRPPAPVLIPVEGGGQMALTISEDGTPTFTPA